MARLLLMLLAAFLTNERMHGAPPGKPTRQFIASASSNSCGCLAIRMRVRQNKPTSCRHGGTNNPGSACLAFQHNISRVTTSIFFKYMNSLKNCTLQVFKISTFVITVMVIFFFFLLGKPSKV